MAELRERILCVIMLAAGKIKAADIVTAVMGLYGFTTTEKRGSIAGRKRSQIISSELTAGVGRTWDRPARGVYAYLGFSKKERGAAA